MKKISLEIPDNDYDKLKNLKKNYHINISSFVVEAIKEKLGKEKPLEK
jgi:predicted DNA-binding protein